MDGERNQGQRQEDATEGCENVQREPRKGTAGCGGDDVWAASLYTVLSMVGVADEARGERANGRVREVGGRVECVAFSGDISRTGGAGVKIGGCAVKRGVQMAMETETTGIKARGGR